MTTMWNPWRLSGAAVMLLVAACNDSEVTAPSTGSLPSAPTASASLTLAGRIAFMSDRSGQAEIYRMNPDGSGVTRLTNTGNSLDPAWSADGTKIVFVSGTSDVLYVMSANGTGITPVPNTLFDRFPRWSPSGTKIAFEHIAPKRVNGRLVGFTFEIDVIKPDGSGLTRLTSSGFDRGPIAWSPDGTRIAFASTRDGGNSEIYIMHPDGSGATRITHNSSNDFSPAWSPDGKKIAFVSDRAGNFEIYTMKVDGTGVARLTNNLHDDGDPAWSPDGTRIAFESDRNSRSGVYEIYAMNANGSGVIRLTNNSAVDDEPAWGR